MQIQLNRLQLETIPENPFSDVWRKDVSFSSGSGYLLRAPSGSGKTTIVSVLCGLRKDYSGSVSFDGKDLSRLSLNGWAALRRKTLSVIFQELKLFDQLTAEENVRIKLNLTLPESKDRIQEFAARLGMSDHMQKKVAHLSVGQKQRIAIIRALVQPFSFLLMDEPFSHLDPENTKRACSLIQEVCAQQQAGFILTSLHDTYDLNYSAILHL